MSFAPHRWLCRCLAPDALCPTAALQDSLDAPNFAWAPMLALAHRHLVAGSWYAALQRRGLLERVPVEMAEHLAALHALSIKRNQLLRRAYLRVGCSWFGQPLPDSAHSSMTVAWLEWKFALCCQHPRVSRGFYWLMRLKRLPKRLLTPSWYPAKIRELRQGKPL